MDLTFDPQSWQRPAHDSARSDALGTGRPEWHALAARLAAAHAFQRRVSPFALMAGAFPSRGAAPSARQPGERAGLAAWSAQGGSFHPGTARALAAFVKQDDVDDAADAASARGVTPCVIDEAKVLANVNPKSSGDRKDASGNGFDVAGPILSGNRGLK